MRKKIIKTFGFIILSNIPLITMATSISTTSSETSISKITQTFKTKLRTKFVNNWVTETEENNNNNITDGSGGVIFEDSRGNLWAMASYTPLQKYNYKTNGWSVESSSNIRYGYNGVIFEDFLGNLWSMGDKTSIQKYDYCTKKWTEETDIISENSDQDKGVIFEDSRKNLWKMRFKTKLQKYNHNTKKWIAETKAKDNSNIVDGHKGVIFED